MISQFKLNRNMGQALRKRYALGLSIITLLIILSQFAIQFVTSKEEDDSRVINIAGRQRMLSQRINKAAFGLYIAEDRDSRNSYLKELKNSVDLWKESHLGLKNGNEAMGLPGKNSKAINQMFANIEENHKIILNAAYGILAMAEKGQYDKETLYPKIQQIKENESAFLQGMNDIVFQYDSESKGKIHSIRVMEIGLFLVIIFVISLEVKFIFMPAEKQIDEAFLKVQEGYSNVLKIFEIAPIAMFLLDDENLQILQLNKLAAEKIGQTEKEDNISLKLDTILGNAMESTLGSNNDIIHKIKNKEKLINEEAILYTSSFSKLSVLISSSRIYMNNKSAIILGISDITKQKEAEEVLKHFANIDGMTGLLNKRSGWLILEKVFRRAQNENLDICICFIDIDGLKIVNDTYGHEEGDWYIINIARIILENMRLQDHAFRYGGDEIILILSDCNHQNGQAIVQRVENSLTLLAEQTKKPYKISISSGVVNFKTVQPDSVEEFVKYADEVMYENKKRKRAGRV